uniref:Uncharacterized protein n=1 Tax=Anguilla anguilla TaxID=7936 RepID=A0A0E9WS25_ANGAN
MVLCSCIQTPQAPYSQITKTFLKRLNHSTKFSGSLLQSIYYNIWLCLVI